jgi:hypothetical protein
LLAAGLLLAWCGIGNLQRVKGIPYPHGLSAWVNLVPLTEPVGLLVLSLLFVSAVVAFVLRWRPELAALLMGALLALFGHIQIAQWTGDIGANRAIILPGAGVLAYGLGRLWALPRDEDDAIAEGIGIDAACGIAAATYLLSGFSKVFTSGLGWASGSNLAMHISVHGHAGLAALRPYRLAMADHLWVCALFGIGTLIIECGFVFFVFPRFRKSLAIAAACMHIGIGLVIALHHYDWLFLCVGLGFYPVIRRSPPA